MRRLLFVIVTVALVAACGGDDDDPSAVAGDDTTTTTATSAPTTTTSEPSTESSTRDPNQRYRVTTTILESPEHGPQLCLGGMMDSYPPQCGGPDVVGWSWDAVDGEESAGGTTWTSASVTGTYDGERFTLTEPPGPPSSSDSGDDVDFSPACDDPDGDPNADRETFRGADDPEVVAVWVSDPGGEWEGPLVYSVVVRPGHADRVRDLVRQDWAGLLCVVERDQPTRAELEAAQSAIDMQDRDNPLGGIFGSYGDERRGVVVVMVGIADDVSVAWAAEHWGPLVVLDGVLEPID